MMRSTTAIFITGATGYVGGAVLTRLLQHPDAKNFSITALVRSEEKASKLKYFGVRPAHGLLSDLDQLERWASEANIVINCADSDHLPSAEAMLNGLRKRHSSSSEVSTFIHTSGTGVIRDHANGMYVSSHIYYDSNPAQMAAIPPTQPHRIVDLTLVEADREGYVKSYIIMPSCIYGIATGPLVDAEMMNFQSYQIPTLIKAALARGRTGMVGEGKNMWENAHIDDIANLYMILLDSVLSGTKPGPGHGENGYYFGENDEHAWYDIAKAIAVTLVELGLHEDDEPTAFSEEEIIHYLGQPDYHGSNARARGQHSRSIGWKPTKTKKDLMASIKPEVIEMLRHADHVGVIFY